MFVINRASTMTTDAKEGAQTARVKFSWAQKAAGAFVTAAVGAMFMFTTQAFTSFGEKLDTIETNTSINEAQQLELDRRKLWMDRRDSYELDTTRLLRQLSANQAALYCEMQRNHGKPCELEYERVKLD